MSSALIGRRVVRLDDDSDTPLLGTLTNITRDRDETGAIVTAFVTWDGSDHPTIEALDELAPAGLS